MAAAVNAIRRFRAPVGAALELILLGVLCLLSVRHWLGRVNLSPDSTTYITASSNLIRTGRLFYFVNAASESMDPEVEPYTEQPPGFVYYLSPFVVLLGEPMQAAVVAQSAAIAAFYAALLLLLRKLRFVPLLRVLILLISAFLAPFVGVRSFLWSETLFIAVSFAVGWIAIGVLQGDWRRSEWLWLCALLVAGSLIRLVGVANVAWIFPILFRRRHLRAGIRLLTHRLIAWSLVLLGLGTVAVFLFADLLGLGSREGIGPTQLMGILLGVGALLVGGGTLALLRASKIRAWSAAQDAGAEGRDLWPIAALAAGVLPVLLWMLRNLILYGAVSLTNKPFEVFYPDHLLVPFTYFLNGVLSLRFLPTAGAAAVTLALLAVPFFVGSSQRRLAHLSLIGAGLAQFGFVWIPSLASQVSNLDARLLAPTMALMLVAAMDGIQAALDLLASKKWAPLLLLIPVIYLASARSIVPGELLSYPGRINYPVEMALWRELYRVEQVRLSTHFYSDRDFVHQIFAGIPQRILWDTSILRDPQAIRAFLTSGHAPFILLRQGSWEDGAVGELMASGQVPLERTTFTQYRFVLYYPAE